jgi:hypothetical protein
MKIALRLISITLLAGVLALGLSGNAAAQNPYLALADTYTDINSPAVNHGSDTSLLLSASNHAGCVPATYLWYQFSIPAIAQTIGQANLYLSFENIGARWRNCAAVQIQPDRVGLDVGQSACPGSNGSGNCAERPARKHGDV